MDAKESGELSKLSWRSIVIGILASLASVCNMRRICNRCLDRRSAARSLAMKLSPAGLDLIRRSEGFRSRVYIDIAGFPTIGYGHRLRPGESFPNGVTDEQANQILNLDISSAVQAVVRLVHVPLTQGQFDALCDFVFNLGSGRLASSTLLVDLNAGQYADAASQLLRWDHGEENGREVEVAALKARRQAEYELWQEAA